MPLWVIAAAVASIVVTAILTLILWRMNESAMREPRQSNGGGDGTPYIADPHATRSDRNDVDFGDGSDSGSGGGGE